MPDLFKIGKTQRLPKERAAELSQSTGLPTTFQVAYALRVTDCNLVEHLIHLRLDSYRVRQDREFFRMDEQSAVKIVRELAAPYSLFQSMKHRGQGMAGQQENAGIFKAKIPENICEKLKQRKKEVWDSIGDIPDEFFEREPPIPEEVDAFDVNDVLSIFDNIALEDDYVLDYVYAGSLTNGGHPLVYARKINSIPLFSPREWHFRSDNQDTLLGEDPSMRASPDPDYNRYLCFQKSPTGFFEFALFSFIVGRFYLYWHSNYDDREFILTRKDLDSYITEGICIHTAEEMELLREMDPAPSVVISGNQGEVQLLNYEINRGYSLLCVRLEWPNKFLESEDKVLVKSTVTMLY